MQVIRNLIWSSLVVGAILIIWCCVVELLRCGGGSKVVVVERVEVDEKKRCELSLVASKLGSWGVDRIK
jgi:hypothetical protein